MDRDGDAVLPLPAMNSNVMWEIHLAGSRPTSCTPRQNNRPVARLILSMALVRQ